MGRLASVYYNDLFAGTLIEEDSCFRFNYDPSYQLNGTPIGFNFPLSKSSYIHKELFPFFDNLISEGWLLDLQANTQHLDQNDRFALLLRNGRDLTGSITVVELKS